MDRHDTALVLLLYDTGMRREEAANLRLTDIDWRKQTLYVTGKGGYVRWVPFGYEAARALDRYLRARAKRRMPYREELWLGANGPMTGRELLYVLQKRAREADVSNVFPHRFRHSFAHEFLSTGGQESDLMQIAGWQSSQMVRHYGASMRSERAREAHRRHFPADRLWPSRQREANEHKSIKAKEAWEQNGAMPLISPEA